jgi:hypothetical protein
MSFLGRLFGRKRTKREARTTSPGKAEGRRVAELVAALEPDILAGGDSDITGRSSKAAVELSGIGKPAVQPLIQALFRSSYAHFALGLIGGETAFQALCAELQTGNWRRIEAAAKALGRIGDPRALELLKPHVATRSAEVYQAVSTAIASIERAQLGEERWLQVDRVNPHGQLRRVWSQFDQIRKDPSVREGAIQWYREFVAAMPELSFGSDDERGVAWGMLGTLIYYFLHPQETSIFEKCPEAAYCYERCLEYTPDRVDIRAYLETVR